MDELPQGDKERLEKILMKPVHELPQDEIDFLNARRDYLPYATKVAYKDVLIEDNNEVSEEEAVANTQQPQTEYTDPNAGQQTEQQATGEQAASTENPEGQDTGNGQSEEANPYSADPNAA